jgi:hypothetical protein
VVERITFSGGDGCFVQIAAPVSSRIRGFADHVAGLIENFQPHFHLRGKSMQVEAILPDGSSQIVSYVGNFNFNWMTNYIYADNAAPVFPKGTVIHVTAWYDNTKANKNNPDPDQWVGYGDRTVDEMAHAWMNVVYLNDDEYKALLAERKGQMAQAVAAQKVQ